jgi:hypothetical protein
MIQRVAIARAYVELTPWIMPKRDQVELKGFSQ